MNYRQLLLVAAVCGGCSGKAQFDSNAGSSGSAGLSAGGASSAGASTSAGGASAAGTAAGSSGTSAAGAAGASSTRVPKNHRASGSICTVPRTAILSTSSNGPCISADGGVCQYSPCEEDSDCIQGSNGRCAVEGPGAPRFVCTYDECTSDSDCAANTPCQCRDEDNTEAPDFCVAQSGCRVDADCGPSGFCSPTLLNQWCGSTYQCHTPADTCLDDSDCTAPAGCNFNATLEHWACGGDCGEPPP